MASPPEREVKDFQFKQLLKVKVGPLSKEITKNRVSLLATSNKYGLSFIGTHTGFNVLKTSDLLAKSAAVGKATSAVIDDLPFWKSVALSSSPTFLGLSSDSAILAVCFQKQNLPFALMFDIRCFADQTTPAVPFLEVKLGSTPQTQLQDAMWNPGADYPSLFATVLSDGNLALWDIKDSLTCVANNPPSAGRVTCVCWSPKGKQLLAGLADGKFVQYDQTLKVKKEVPSPTGLYGDKAVTALDVTWESTYVYIAALIPSPNPDGDQPCLVHITCAKNMPVTYTNLEDICFGGGTDRLHKYYFNIIAEWKLIVSASANALEAAILGKNPQNEAIWERWSLEDSSRAELPMTADYEETYPVGMAIDQTSTSPIPIGDSQTLPPAPIFLLLSTEGVLSTFHMIDIRPGMPSIQKQITQLSSQGVRINQGLAQSVAPAPSQPEVKPAAPQQEVKPAFPATAAAFGQTAFGNQATPASSGGGLFGSTPSGATSGGGGSIFGQSQTSSGGSAAQQSPGLFNVLADPSANKTSTPTFGGPAITTTNLFGTGGKGIFGTASSDNADATKADQTPVMTSSGGGFLGQVLSNATQSSSSATTGSQAPSGSLFGNQQSGSGFTFGAATTKASGDKPASIVGNPQKPALGFSANLQTPSSASNVSIQKPAASIAQPLSFNSTPQKPADTSTPKIVPKSELFGQSSASSFTPVDTGNKKPTTPLTFGGKVKDEVEVKGQGQPTNAATDNHLQTTPVKGAGPEDANRSVASAGRKRGAGAARTEDPFLKALVEEMQHFQQEMRDFKSRSASLDVDVGSRDELEQLKTKTADMSEFCEEIKATTQSINEDIHELKYHCLEGFATLEECRLRHERHNDEHYHKLLASRALDPVSERKMRLIQTHYQYLDAGLRDLDLKLDAEWESYQRSKNGGKNLKTPATDMIYRTLTNNQRVVDTYNATISDLTTQLTNLRMHNTSSQWNSSRHGSIPRRTPSIPEPASSPRPYTPRTLGQRNVRNSTLNRSTLSESSFRDDKSSPQKAAAVAISPEKQYKLREVLGQRRITPVKATAPANLSMSRLLATDLLKDDLSLGESFVEEEEQEQPETPPSPPVQQTTRFAPTIKPAEQQIKDNNRTKSATQLQNANSQNHDGTNMGFRFATSATKQPLSETTSGTSGVSLFGNKKEISAPSGSSFPQSGGKSTGFASFSPAKSTAFTSVNKSEPLFTQQKNNDQPAKQAVELQKVDVTKLPPSAGFSFNAANATTTAFSFAPKNKSDEIKTTSFSGSEALNNQYPALSSLMQPAKSDDVAKTSTPGPSDGNDYTKSIGANSTGSALFGNKAKDGGKTSNLSAPVQQSTETPEAKPFNFGSSQVASQQKASPFSFGTSKVADGASPFTLGKGEGTQAPSMGFSFGGSTASMAGNAGDKGSENTTQSQTPKKGFSFNKPAPPDDQLKTSKSAFGESSGLFGSSGFSFTSVDTKPTFGNTEAEDGEKDVATSAPSNSKVVTSSSASDIQGQGDASKTATQTKVKQSGSGESGLTGNNISLEGLLRDAQVSSSTQEKLLSKSASEAPRIESVNAPFSTTQAAVDLTAKAIAPLLSAALGGIARIAQKPTPPAVTKSDTVTSTNVVSSVGNAPISSATAVTNAVNSSGDSFGGIAATNDSSSKIAGPASTTPTTPSVGVLGGTATTVAKTTPSAEIFGVTATTAATAIPSTGIFGVISTTPSTTTPSSSIFGGTAAAGATSTPSSEIFGSVTSTAQTSGFTDGTTTQSGGGIFGTTTTSTTTPSTAATATSSGGIFGTPISSATTSSSGVFGSGVTSATTASTFETTGGAGMFSAAQTTSSATTSSSAFGSQSTTAPPVFGQTNVTSASGFGNATSVFGTPSVSAGGSGIFGQQTATTPSVFGQPTSTASGGFGTSGFGQPTATFGASAPLFGSQPATSTSTSGGGGIFGSSQTSQTGSVFGGGSAQSSQSGSVFGGGSGGLFSGLGGQPSAENANKNVFGGGSFGSTSGQSQGGLFGSNTGSSSGGFGSTATGSGGFSGSGTFSSGGGGGVAATGFGGFGSNTPQTPQNQGGFGQKPVFGATSPSFGGSPAFGSAPAFGSSPGMGSTFGGGAIFGSAGGQQSTPSSGGFASFAGANAPTFGAIAQQTGNSPGFGGMAQQAQSPQPGFGGLASGQQQPNAFGSPAFGGGGAGSGFGNQNQNSSFGQNASFTSYRG